MNRSLRSWWVLVALMLAACGADRSLCAADAPPPAAGWSVAYLGAVIFPSSARGPDGRPHEITGLSGVTWLGGDRYAAVMDNSANLILFTLEVSPTGQPLAISDISVVVLSQRHDYEDLAPAIPPALGVPVGSLFLCEEDTPAIHRVALADGVLHGTVPLPPVLRKPRPNRGLESLALDPSGRRLWTATEEAVPADGPPSGPAVGTLLRLVCCELPAAADPAPLPAGRQTAYAVDPPHALLEVMAGPQLSGVTALVACGAGRLLVLERSAGPGLPPFANRIYLVDTLTAPDVSACIEPLEARGEWIASKTLLWEGALGINLEGLCWGAAPAVGGRVLVGVADNGGLRTPNQLVGFSCRISPESPATSP
jgi:hypothetical protein